MEERFLILAALVAAAPLFWRAPERYRYGFLGAVSLGCLWAMAPFSVSVLLVWTIVFYWALSQAAIGKEWRGKTVVSLIVGVCGYLFYFKYNVPATADSQLTSLEGRVLIPLGISYYTFKLIHYAVEVYRGNIPEHSFQQFFCYIYLFPIFTAGPIQRFDLFLANEEKVFGISAFVEGATRLIHGMVKKFLICDFLHEEYIDDFEMEEFLEKLPGESPLEVLCVLSFAYLFIYLSFSAYTDLAIGGSRLFGFRIMENFHFPYVAKNIVDFWRRWHMTLAGWCQSYIFMPVLGLYRKPVLALYASFFVMGMWHSGTLSRLFWGLYHASGVYAFRRWEKFKKRKGWKFPETFFGRALGLIITQVFVCGSMAFVLVEFDFGVNEAFRILARFFFIDLPR